MIEFLWGLVPAWAQWGLIACAALFVMGVIWRIKDVLAFVFALAKKIAGWPGVAAVIAALAIAAALFWRYFGVVGRLFAGRAAPTIPSLRWPKGRTAKRSLPVPKSLSESN